MVEEIVDHLAVVVAELLEVTALKSTEQVGVAENSATTTTATIDGVVATVIATMLEVTDSLLPRQQRPVVALRHNVRV